MIAAVCQRWRDRRGTYRPAREVFDPRVHDVAEIAQDRVARAFVVQHHYSGTYPAARRRFGLYEGGALVGVAVFSVPMSYASLRPWGPGDAVELGRLVLLDRVLANAESWFVRRALDALARDGFAGVVSHSDPVARCDVDGRAVFAGHIGTVYQALGAVYTGRASPRTMLVAADGRLRRHRGPDGAPCRCRALVRDAVAVEALTLAELASACRMRASTRRALLTNPLRPRRPGDLRRVLRWDDRAAVAEHAAARLRAWVEGGA